MLLRFAVFAMMALGLGGFGTVAWLTLQTPAAPPTAVVAEAAPAPPEKHAVLTAAAVLRAGTLLKPEDVTVMDVAEAGPGTQSDTPGIRAGMVGAMLRRSLTPGEPLLAADVMRPGDHGFLAAVLTPGRRAASVAVDAVSGSAGLIWPGDHVDVILTQALDDPALPPARRVAAETVLTDARVIAIDQLLARGVAPSEAQAASSSRTVTLEVTPADAARIAVATKLGRLSLAVRAAEDAPRASDTPAIASVPTISAPTTTAPAVIVPTATSPAAPAAVPVDVATTWGGDVSAALGGDPSRGKGAGLVLRLYSGNADGKEFRFP